MLKIEELMRTQSNWMLKMYVYSAIAETKMGFFRFSILLFIVQLLLIRSPSTTCIYLSYPFAIFTASQFHVADLEQVYASTCNQSECAVSEYVRDANLAKKKHKKKPFSETFCSNPFGERCACILRKRYFSHCFVSFANKKNRPYPPWTQ